MSDLSPQCAPKRTSADHSEFMVHALGNRRGDVGQIPLSRARQHGIPLVENKPLAQTLFKTAEVGEAIPGPLFAAVAEVLAQLIRLKQLVL